MKKEPNENPEVEKYTNKSKNFTREKLNRFELVISKPKDRLVENMKSEAQTKE